MEYKCEFCNKEFKNRKAIGKHIQPKTLGECKKLYFEKYKNIDNLPWNKKVKCLTDGCDNLIDPLTKTHKCHHCATKDVLIFIMLIYFKEKIQHLKN